MEQNPLLIAAENAVSKTTKVVTFTQTEDYFQKKWNMATAISTSALIPSSYRGKIADVMIAMELSEQMHMSLFTVTQNLDIIKGKAGWKSTFIIATINSSDRFNSNLKFEWKGNSNSNTWGCRAYAEEKDNTILYGSWITIEMANQEGWTKKEGSKWISMPEQMLQYRAASFFGRLHVPDLLMGLQAVEEVIDIMPITKEVIDKANELPDTSVNTAVDKKIEEMKKQNKKVSQDIFVETLKELKEQLDFLGFKIIQIKENSLKRKWAKIISSSEDADFDLILMIEGIKKLNSTDNFYVMDITNLG